LLFLSCLPSTPARAAEARPKDADLFWIEATLVGVDAANRTVSYRLTTGDLATASLASDSALKKLSGMKAGQEIKLRCNEPTHGTTVVWEAKRAKEGHNWWKWGVLMVLVVTVVALIAGATEGCGSSSCLI
jgi:hypothetical protein